MNHCEIVADLLALYLDGVCSEESRRFVEDHIAACPGCHALLEEMKQELPQTEISGPAQEEAVLRSAVRRLNSRAAAAAAGVTAIVLYWLVYLWQDGLSVAGNYRYFSYSFHELYTIGYLLVPIATLIWLAALLVRMVRHRTWRKNAVLALILALLLAAQGGYWNHRGRQVGCTTWTEVAEIPDEYHVVIQTGEGPVTLTTTPIVTTLLQQDGTIYGFYYETDRDTPGEGVLHGIWDAVK